LDILLIYMPTQVQLTLMKIIKIVATRWRILRLKCTKFNFGWGSAPDPTGGAYSAPPGPLAGFGVPTSKGRGGEGRKGRGKKGPWAPNIWRKFTPMNSPGGSTWMGLRARFAPFLVHHTSTANVYWIVRQNWQLPEHASLDNTRHT